MCIVLGIDPSTKCGLAVVDSSKKILHTSEVEFKKLDGFERIQAIAGKVMELMEEYKPDLVVIEGMFVGHASSAITVIQIGSILRYFLWQEGVQYLEVGPTVLKKFVVGSGNAKKEQMMMGVLKHWGFESPTNNIADAVGLAMFGQCAVGASFTQAERVLAKATVKESSAGVQRLVARLSSAIICK